MQRKKMRNNCKKQIALYFLIIWPFFGLRWFHYGRDSLLDAAGNNVAIIFLPWIIIFATSIVYPTNNDDETE